MDERIEYRDIIHQIVAYCAKGLVEVMRDFNIQPEPSANYNYPRFLLRHSQSPASRPELSQASATATDAIWKDPCITKVKELSNRFYLTDSALHWFDNVERIAPGFIPTDADVVRARPKSNGISKTEIMTGLPLIQIIDVGEKEPTRSKWIHQFDNTTSILFMVDLACYDRMLNESPGHNAMMEQLVIFDSVVNSGWFIETPTILFLNNVDNFKAKLARSLLSNYFPDYSGGKDVNRAAKYLLWRFNSVNRAHLNLYPHSSSGPNDPSNLRLVVAAVKQTIIDTTIAMLGTDQLPSQSSGAWISENPMHISLPLQMGEETQPQARTASQPHSVQ
ncbi:guanine nucleotide binding protein, alpha subunit [Phaeosphaeriaceae sp. PMI808]|nr:guanine nucleotide binding protein, alpha subunit [Phaeosphaeriaceae sp. PMI808]